MGTDDEDPYRAPRDPEAEEDLSAEDLERMTENSPLVRLGNMILLELIRSEHEVLRLRTDRGPVEVRTLEGRWTPGIDPPAHLLPDLARRYQLMAALPPRGRGEAAMGWIELRIGGGRAFTFSVFVRPAGDAEVVILREIPPALRDRIAPGPRAEPDPLRWKAEHAQRLARGKTPERALPKLRELVDEAAARGREGLDLRLRTAWVLAELESERGAVDEAVAVLDDCVDATRQHLGGGPRTAELLAASADILAERDLDAAIGRVEQALTEAQAAFALDPLVAELHRFAADLLDGAGRADDARAHREAAADLLTELTGPDDDAIAPLRPR